MSWCILSWLWILGKPSNPQPLLTGVRGYINNLHQYSVRNIRKGYFSDSVGPEWKGLMKSNHLPNIIWFCHLTRTARKSHESVQILDKSKVMETQSPWDSANMIGIKCKHYPWPEWKGLMKSNHLPNIIWFCHLTRTARKSHESVQILDKSKVMETQSPWDSANMIGIKCKHYPWPIWPPYHHIFNVIILTHLYKLYNALPGNIQYQWFLPKLSSIWIHQPICFMQFHVTHIWVTGRERLMGNGD